MTITNKHMDLKTQVSRIRNNYFYEVWPSTECCHRQTVIWNKNLTSCKQSDYISFLVGWISEKLEPGYTGRSESVRLEGKQQGLLPSSTRVVHPNGTPEWYSRVVLPSGTIVALTDITYHYATTSGALPNCATKYDAALRNSVVYSFNRISLLSYIRRRFGRILFPERCCTNRASNVCCSLLSNSRMASWLPRFLCAKPPIRLC